MVRDLRTPEGGFASLDADSDGRRGRVLRVDAGRAREVLGPDDGAFAARLFGVTEPGTFEHGASTLQLRPTPRHPAPRVRLRPRADARPGEAPPYPAALSGISPDEWLDRFAAGCWPPARADPAGPRRQGRRRLERPGDRGAGRGRRAARPARLSSPPPRPRPSCCLRHHPAGRLGRVAHRGRRAPRRAPRGLRLRGRGAARAARGHRRSRAGWRPRGSCSTPCSPAFADGPGGFYDTAADAEQLILRPADPTDNATPSGGRRRRGAAQLRGPTGEARYAEAAGAALRVLPPIAARYPRAWRARPLGRRGAAVWLRAEIAIVGPDEDPRTADLLRAALHAAPPGAVLALGSGAPDAAARPRSAAVRRPPVSGGPAAAMSAAVSPAWHR